MTPRRRMRKALPVAAALALVLGMSACSSASEEPQDAAPIQTTPPTTDAPDQTDQPDETEDGIVVTIVHFTAGDVVVEVVIDEDNSTTRSFLAMLPMTLAFSDFGGKEKVATPTGDWDFTDAEGLDPEVGDLFSYMPWGNIGFFYNTDGNTFSNDLTRIGATDDVDQIQLLDGQQVTIAVVG